MNSTARRPFPSPNPARLRRFLGLLGLLGVLSLAGAPAAAQNFEGMRGLLTDAAGQPLSGYRAVYRPVEGEESFVSGISDASGNYVISLPLGGEFVPIALITPNGGRIELPADEPPLVVRKGGGRNIQLPQGTTPESANNRDIPVAGKIADAEGNPLAGYRIVFKLDDAIFLSEPSRANGEYTIELRERLLFTPLAAIAPNGLRIVLADESTLQPRANTRRDFTVQVSGRAHESAFAGADRLFLSFAEDTVVTGFIHEQTQLEIARIDSRDVLVSRLIAAAQLPGLEDTEFGLSVGYGSYDPLRGPDVTGLTDVDLWAKLDLGAARDGTGYGVGFVLTAPTGEDAPGLGHDAWSTKFFAAGRRSLGRGQLTANVGVRVSGNGMKLGIRREGQVSVAVGGGWVAPLHPNLNLVLEAAVETERYSGVDPEFRLLGGINWRVRDITVRLALAGGLTDASPDYQFLGGIAFEF